MDENARLMGLLSVKRSPLKAGLVDAVMAQPVSTFDKIQRIEMIDLLPDAPPPAPVRRRRSGIVRDRPEPLRAAQAASPPPLIDPNLDETERVEHERRHLGRPPSRGGWWKYFFYERQRMAEWGARTGTLMRGLIPFTLKLSPEAVQFGAHELKGEVLPVLENHLPRLLRQAWKTLDKFEYNLLAAARSLCQALAAVQVVGGPRGLVPSFWDPVLPAMVLFWTAEKLPERVLGAWNLLCARLVVEDSVRLGGQDSLRTLLQARTDRVALPDFLRAVLMLRTRRAIPWSALIPRENGDYFARDTFDCPPEVQAEIDRAIDLLRHQLAALEREYFELRRIRYFLPASTLLEEFDHGENRTNLARWSVKFLERAEIFFPLLLDPVELRGGERAVLFRDIALTSAVKRLGALRSQPPDEQELPAMVARVVTNIGRLVVQQIRNRSVTADPVVRSNSPAATADPLPFETIELEAPGWEGVSVIDALVKTARICLLAGRLLGDTSLETELEREAPLRTRAKDLLATLVRLARPEDIADIGAAWAEALGDSAQAPV